jgi:hypothetical protein
MKGKINTVKIEDIEESSMAEDEFLSDCDRFSENDVEDNMGGLEGKMKRLVKEFKIQIIAEKNMFRRNKKSKNKK